jgi:hypothetical protein
MIGRKSTSFWVLTNMNSDDNFTIAAAENDVLTLVEAAALLRVHPVTLRKRAVQWGVPHRRLA